MMRFCNNCITNQQNCSAARLLGERISYSVRELWVLDRRHRLHSRQSAEWAATPSLPSTKRLRRATWSCGPCSGRSLSARRLEPATDLSGAMAATLDRLVGEGWQAEATPEYGFVFIR